MRVKKQKVLRLFTEFSPRLPATDLCREKEETICWMNNLRVINWTKTLRRINISFFLIFINWCCSSSATTKKKWKRVKFIYFVGGIVKILLSVITLNVAEMKCFIVSARQFSCWINNLLSFSRKSHILSVKL